MSTSFTSSVSFSSIATGTDWTETIDALMEVESYKLTKLKGQQEDYTEKSTAASDLNTYLNNLETYLEDLDSVGELMAMNGESSDSSALGLTVDETAEAGSHSITVNQLATNDVWVNTSTSYSATSDVVTTTAGTITLEYAGQEYTITVSADTTLAGLVNAINNNSSLGGNVKATALYDGSGYRLQLRGMDLGADNTLAITASTVSGYATTDFTHTQTAQNAQIKVDGYPTGASNWMEFDTNTIEGVIEGVSLTLKGKTTDATITVSVDTDKTKENIENFVSGVNEILLAIQEVYNYTQKSSSDEEDEEEDEEDSDMSLADKSTLEGGALSGNYAVRQVKDQMKSVLSSSGQGFIPYDLDTGLGDLYSSLSQIGITTDADAGSETFGLLVIDNAKLNEALSEDPVAVAKLLSADYEGYSSSTKVSFDSLIEGTTEAGEYEVEYNIVGGVLVSATINGNEASVSGWQITGKAGNPESGLSLSVEDHTNGSYSSVVGVKLGKIGELVATLSDLTDSTSGPLNILTVGLEEQISTLDSEISDEQDRLDRKEEYYKNKFSRLETSLAELNKQQETLESLIDQMNKSD